MTSFTKSERWLPVAILVLGALIVLYETDFVNPPPSYVIAQDERRPLLLKRGNVIATIPVGDWIVAVDNTGKKVLATDKLMRWDGVQITVEPPKGSEKLIKPEMIGTLYYGEAKRVGYYTGRGFIRGAQVGCIGGLVVGAIMATDPCIGPAGFLIGPIFVSIYAVPGGTAIGLLNGLVKHGRATEYSLGPGQWEIVKEELP